MSYALCYVCDEYPPVVRAYGGIGTAFQEQAEGFARRGRRVDVICRTSDREAGVHVANGVRVHVVRPCTVPKARALVDRFRLTTLLAQLCSNPCDIVVSSEYSGPLMMKGFRNPLVVQLEGSMTLSAVGQNLQARRLVRYFERRTVNLADEVSAVSQFTAAATLSALGAHPRRVHVFPNSVDADLFCPAPQEVDPNRVLFVGKLNRLKGIFVLADAIRTVFARLPSATLTVIGSDHVERGESCQERFLNCFSASERSRVRMLGPLSHGDVAFEVRRCNVLVLPSFTEMCPVVVLEAMSCGRPVVASNRAGIPEIVQDGRTGLLANPDCPATFADALTRLLSDRSLADAMGTAGREAVLQKYTSDSVVDRLQHFYAEISDRTAQR